MKLYLYPFFLILAGLLFVSCKKSKDDDIAYYKEFTNSYRAFDDFKASSGNSYSFTVITASWAWGRSGTETTIKVKDGKAIERSYVSKRVVNYTTNEEVILEQWTEDEASLRSHQSGFTLFTLDEVYQKAKTDWLLKRNDTDTYFEAGNNGMLSNCGYVPRGCTDDCFTGITISAIVKL